MRFTRRLSIRLFVLLSLSMAVVFGAFLVLTLHFQKKYLLECATVSSARTSDLVVSALSHSMLENNRNEIYHTIMAISKERDVRGVRIINKLGRIMFSSSRKEIGTTVNMSAEACILCHQASLPISEVTDFRRTRVFASPENETILGIISPIRNAPECSNADCHAHDPATTILGILDLKMSLERANYYMSQTRDRSIVYEIASIFLIALLFGVSIFYMVERPIKELTKGTVEISKGNLDYRINIKRRDEIGQLAQSFNRMTKQLKEAREEITELNRSLERRVEQKTRQLRQAEAHMREIDKLASLGKLAASVAHELNNPLAGILTYSKLLERKLTGKHDIVDPEIIRVLNVIEDETSRCGQIVKDLLLFARREGDAFVETSLHEVIEKSLKIVWHKIELQEIQVTKKLNLENDRLQCDPAQVRQALIALLINAIEAIPGHGAITIETEVVDDNRIALNISDTGVGIPEEVRDHIFEPFFSTKEESKGVGLGLSVVFGIVQRHHGTITVSSKPGEGSTIRIILPRRQPGSEQQAPRKYDAS
ncbi:MAG: HAMP domain-containing protein [Chlorobi bacterium]|nr:HAMP domain-containing protein [Chlorobiota bacterium]